MTPHRIGLLALLPMFVFIGCYLAAALCAGDFYAMPVAVAFVAAAVTAVAVVPGKVKDRITIFTKGASDNNILIMVWIFVLAGAFAASAKSIGAVEATVNLTLSVLPDRLLLMGLFLAACLVSFAIGTSVGTIVALTPIAVGAATTSGASAAMMVGAIVSGSFFGDNLSFISDTTIAATQSQRCAMRDKFRTNLFIVLPAALATCAIYFFYAADLHTNHHVSEVNWPLTIPYLAVIAMAVAGVDVLMTLSAGVALNIAFGLFFTQSGALQLLKSVGDGISGMGDLITVTLLAGGVLGCIHHGGGITYIIERLSLRIRGPRSAELVMAGLVTAANLCTANNTIAIITTGGIARDIAQHYGIPPRKAASVLDVFSCFAQGLIPYGAQLLMAGELGGLTAIEIIPWLHYTWLVGLSGLVSIVFKFRGV